MYIHSVYTLYISGVKGACMHVPDHCTKRNTATSHRYIRTGILCVLSMARSWRQRPLHLLYVDCAMYRYRRYSHNHPRQVIILSSIQHTCLILYITCIMTVCLFKTPSVVNILFTVLIEVTHTQVATQVHRKVTPSPTVLQNNFNTIGGQSSIYTHGHTCVCVCGYV